MSTSGWTEKQATNSVQPEKEGNSDPGSDMHALETIMLNAIGQTRGHTHRIALLGGRVEFVEQKAERGEGNSHCFMDVLFSRFGMMKTFWKWIGVRAVQHCQCTSSQGTAR